MKKQSKQINHTSCFKSDTNFILTLSFSNCAADKSYLYAIAIKTPSSRYKPKSFSSPTDAPSILQSANSLPFPQSENSPPFSVTAIDSGPVNSRNSFVTNQMSRVADIIKELQRKTTSQSKDIDTPVFTQDQVRICMFIHVRKRERN